MKDRARTRRFGIAQWLAAAALVWAGSSAAVAATITAPSNYVIPEGVTSDVPISVTDAGAGVVGVDLIVRYNGGASGDIVTATGVNVTGTELDGWTVVHNIVTNVDGNGTDEIRISAASGGAALTASGTATLLKISFAAIATTSPKSSPLTLTLADLNESAVTAVNGTLKLGGDTGDFTFSPDPVKPSETLTITLTDVDLAGAPDFSLAVRSKSGATIKETGAVIMSETATPGVFEGTVSVVYGTTANTGTSALEVVPGDKIEVEYIDALDANGAAGTVIIDSVNVVAGSAATVTSSPATVTVPTPVVVSVTDPDQAGKGTLAVTVKVRNPNGTVDTETITLTETPANSGIFTASVATSSAAPGNGNGVLNMQPGDQVLVSYNDPVGTTGAPVPNVLSLTPTNASFSVPAQIEVSQTLAISLTDSDIAAGTRASGTTTATVTVRNVTTGETETLALNESASTPGTFTGSIPTTYDAGTSPTSGNGTLGVKPTDVVRVEYQDQLNASGGSSLITSANITVDNGSDATVTTSPATVTAPTPVVVSVTDPDQAGKGTLAVTVKVRNPNGTVDTETITLTETPANSGIFTASVATSSAAPGNGNGVLNMQPGDQVLVSYNDPIGSGGVPVPNVLSLTPTNASFSVPATLKVADPLSVSLTDSDIAAGTRASGTTTATVTVRNVTTGETETLALNESASTPGTFTGSIPTTYYSGTGTLPGSGTLGVKPTDVVRVEYQDQLNASGGSSLITSANISIIGGSDATVTTSPSSITPGKSVTVTVTDGDLGNSGTILATVRSKRGGSTLETQVLTLTATGSGNQFKGTIPTVYGTTPVASNGILEVKKNDTIEADYLDAVTSSGSPITRTSSPATQVLGGATGVLVVSTAVQAGDGLRIQLTDADLDTNSTSAQTISVSVTNNTNGDVESALLTETGNNTGVFRITPSLSTNGGTVAADGVLQLSAKDDIEISYSDVLNLDGGPQTITASSDGVLWGDTSENDKVGALDASYILQRSVLLAPVWPFNAYQELVANVDSSSGDNFNDGSDITASDATLVLQYTVGIINVFPIQNAHPPHPYKRAVDQRRIALGEPLQQGDRLSLPVLMDETSGLLSGQMKLSFDPQRYRLVGVKGSEITAEHLFAANAVENALLIAFAGAREAGSGAGEIMHIELEVLGSPVQGAPLRFEAIELNGGWIQVTATEGAGLFRPENFSLLQNHPNPFNPETAVRYALPQTGHVSLVVYDMLGQKVRTLVDRMQESGAYEVRWNGRDEDGRQVASGLYIYRLEAGHFAQTRKMTLLR